MRLGLLALALLAACAPGQDADEDGFTAAVDCNDGDPTAYPGADERCDGVDQDCDGVVDDNADDAVAYFADADGDGFGDFRERVGACDAPAGYVRDASDCDDTLAAVNPDAVEACNGLDDDCDDVVDPATSVGVGHWYPDADGDGYGRADAEAVQSCDAPAGYVGDATDCGDTNEAVHLGATDVCNGLDDDCDGAIDPDTAPDAATWYADADGDGYGDLASPALACAAPDGFVADAADCDDLDLGAFPGAEERCDGADQDCDGAVDDDATDALVWYADTDADGYGDARATTYACEAPAGHVADDTDCDDDAATVNPGAVERCNGLDDDCNLVVDPDTSADAGLWYPDADGDTFGRSGIAATASCTAPPGYVADATDCADAVYEVNPAALEVCDGVENDCDGVTDPPTAPDATEWYLDADSDGFGDATLGLYACDQPSRYVASDTDCDDGEPLAYPGGDEICDGFDDDCDGVVDPDTSLDAPTWYADTDGDGYGDADDEQIACDAPPAYVASDTDCDDAAAAVHPDTSELCDAADVDEDCDGLTDDDDSAPVGRTSWYEDEDEDGYGAETDVGVLACDAPEDRVDNADDCDDDDDDRHPGGWACTTELTTSAATVRLTPQGSDDSAGQSLWAGDDYDLDGDADYLVGAYYRSGGKGSVYMVEGDRSGTVALGTADLILSDSSLTFVGYWVGPAGDLNGDGNDDLGFLVSRGGYYGYYAPVASTETLSAPDVRLIAETPSDYLTIAAGGFDFNGDGNDDIGVGNSNWSSSRGSAYVAFGPLSGSESLSTAADLILRGEATSDNAGVAMARGGDIDGDGLDDLLVGAEYNGTDKSYAGAAYVIYGGVTGSGLLADADAIIRGPTTNAYVGSWVSGNGDSDGDGYGDFAIGASRNGSSYQGAAWLFNGPVSGTTTTASAEASLVGTAAYDYVGDRIAELSDLDGDGVGDLVVGALFDYSDNASGKGSVYAFFGPVSGVLVPEQANVHLAGATGNGRFGRGLASPGDLDGDGLGELFVGAYSQSGGQSYLFPGSTF